MRRRGNREAEGDAVNSRTVLKAANLVNGKEHMEGKKAGSAGDALERGHRFESWACTHAGGFRNKPSINRREMSE